MAILAGGPPPAKSFCTHLVDYFSSADGPADLLKGVQLSAHWAKAFPLTQESLQTAESVRASASDAWAMLVWGDVVAEGGKLAQKTASLFQAYCAPANAQDEISELFNETLLQGVDFLNPVTEGLDLLHKKQWIDLGKMAPVIYGGFEVTSLISDGVDARNQLNTIAFIEGERRLAIDPDRREALDQRARLCLVRLMKDGASIALSVAGLALAATGAVVESSIVLTGILLFLSTLFLVTKIFAHFYEKMAVQQLGDRLPALLQLPPPLVLRA